MYGMGCARREERSDGVVDWKATTFQGPYSLVAETLMRSMVSGWVKPCSNKDGGSLRR